MKFKRISLLVSLLIANILVISYSSKGDAATQELFSKYFESESANNNLPIEDFHSNQQANFKNNKSSSEQLLGAWESTSVSDSGEKITTTYMYSSDGTYLRIGTRGNKDWYITETGTWEAVGNTLRLSDNTEARGDFEGSIKFPSNDELVYTSDNGETKWQKVDVNPNLSKDQLVGTWSIVVQDRVGNSFIDDSFERSNAKLIELNSDGTFRYKNIDAGIIGLSDIVTKSASGTWTYINSGYADGLLLLKDSQGNLFSFSSINWNEDGNFININRSNYDRDQNKYDPGRIEEFRRSNLIIDEWG